MPTQTDWRKTKHRRKGEKDGPTDWVHFLKEFCYFVIIVALMYGSFMMGRHYETVQMQDSISHASIWKDYKSARIRGH